MNTLMQAHRQWATRPHDQRFTSLTELSAFKHGLRDSSRSTVLSSRTLNFVPSDDNRGLFVEMPDRIANDLGSSALTVPTNWSFGQMAQLAKAPGQYLAGLPSPIAADCLNYGMKFARVLGAHKVRLHYRYRGSGKRGFETVRAYGFLYGSRHYLVAWSENAGDFRNYALASIERVEPLKAGFARRADFTLAGYAAESFGVFHEKSFETVWRFDKKAAPHAREFLFHPSQKFDEQPDGSLLVRLKAGGALEMAWHLRQWGEHVKVMKPKNFWQRVRSAEISAFP